jgi:hypothetical protein
MKGLASPSSTLSVVITVIFFHAVTSAYSQSRDSTKQRVHFSGSAGITNNGISVVPTFAFHKPAGIALLSIAKKRLSFEPDIRFTLDLKKSGVALWWRYKFLPNGKFRLSVGAHPAFNFLIAKDSAKQNSNPVIETQKFLGAEVVPSYLLSKNVSIGLYYLRGHGLQQAGPHNVHFVTINSNFSKIELTKQLLVQWVPQFYYLNIDKVSGFYFTSTETLLLSGFPLSLQSTINKAIKTKISGQNFVWNVSLLYTF